MRNGTPRGRQSRVSRDSIPRGSRVRRLSLRTTPYRIVPLTWEFTDELTPANPAKHAPGQLDDALSWYVGQDRIRTAPTRDQALQAAADAWAADVAEGKDVALLAWRRANVDELNARARAHMEAAGRLSGPEVVAPGGRRYRSGDQVVTLAPGAEGRLVTSQRATVVLVEPDAQALVLRMDDQAVVRLGGEEISAGR